MHVLSKTTACWIFLRTVMYKFTTWNKSFPAVNSLAVVNLFEIEASDVKATYTLVKNVLYHGAINFNEIVSCCL